MNRRTGTGMALLADDTRRMIIGLVALRPRRPSELAEELGLSRPAISRQIAILEQADLVRIVGSRVDRRGRLVMLDYRTQGRIMAWLAGTDLALAESLAARVLAGLDSSAKPEPPSR